MSSLVAQRFGRAICFRLAAPARRLFNTNEEQFAYHAGLKKTQFTHNLEIASDSPTIPIFRILGFDGNLLGDWKLPVTEDELLSLYQSMIRLSVWDDMLYGVQRQGRISFYIQNQGEEALQIGVGSSLENDDVLWCQYRELGVLLLRGFTLEDALNQCFSTKEDPGKGRQMPISYTKREIGLQTICTPLTTQVPHAAGCGYAFKLERKPRVSVAFFGEGAASEGDFHAAMNFAAVLRSQTIFICRNNGYAISTPVKDQYAGDGIAVRGLAYGMKTVRVDGNDLLASLVATREARRMCVEGSEPVCMEFMTYRMGHHSTSDDSTQYRPTAEMGAWAQPGVNAIARTRRLLDRLGLWDDKKDEALKKESKEVLLKAMKVTEKKKRCSIAEGVFSDVYDKIPWHIKEQQKHLADHLKKYPQHYDVSMFEQS